jgi:hypothetical protein
MSQWAELCYDIVAETGFRDTVQIFFSFSFIFSAKLHNDPTIDQGCVNT